MKTYNRICIKDYTIEDQEGTTFTINRGEEYTTSREEDNKVMVFSTYWVWVPSNIFAGEIRFT